MTESIIKGAEAQQNRVGAWYFSRLQPSGTLLAVAPSGERYVVKGGNPHAPEFRRLFDDMAAALSVELGPDHPAVAPYIAAEREACADVADYWMGFDKTASEACEEIAQGIRERAELPDVSRQLAHHARVHLKCDGNHGGPRCADPECWNDDAPVTREQALEQALQSLYTAAMGVSINLYDEEALDIALGNARAALALPAQPQGVGEASRRFFAYHCDMGVEFFNGPDAESAAKSLCEENLELERTEAISTAEWADDRAESICWGVVLGRAKFFDNPGQEGEDSGDYKMVSYATPQQQAGGEVRVLERDAKRMVSEISEDQRAAFNRSFVTPSPSPKAEPVRVPEGYALVPVEPTKEMNVAGFNAHRATGLTGEIWRAMLTAAKAQEGGV